MSQLVRFGRKIAVPSTRQIRHELIVLMREDARLAVLKADGPARAASASAEGLWKALE